MRDVAYVKLYPWSGGLNTANDPIRLDPQELQIADNVVFTNDGSRRKRGGQARLNTTAITVSSVTQNVIFIKDYWANVSDTKRQRLVAVTEDGSVHASSDRGSTWSLKTTTTFNVAQGRITAEVLNEDLVIGYSASAAALVWDAQGTASISTATATAGTYPSGWILRGHKNRMFISGDSSNPDRLRFSGFTASVADHRNWGTSSGFIDIQPGDGDPDGITAIFPEINQANGLYIAKRTKLYFLDTSAADSASWTVSLVSDGIGCVSHNTAVAVDQSDVIFCSDRGVHVLSQVLSGTAIIEGQFVSKQIHEDYQNVMSTADRNKYSAVWYPRLNSYLLGVKRSGQAKFESIYGYNVEIGGWYRWTGTPVNYLATNFNESTGKTELWAADDGGFVNALDQSSALSDLNDFGAVIPLRIRSGVIYPSMQELQNPLPGEKHFVDLAFIFRSRDNSSFRVNTNIDGDNNSYIVQQELIGDNILGTTVLGSAEPFILGTLSRGIKPTFQHIKGVGHSIEVTIEHDIINADLELFGMFIGFKQASESQNPRRNAS